MNSQSKLVVESDDLRQAIRERAGFPQQHRQSAAHRLQPVSVVGKNRVGARIQPLLYAKTYALKRLRSKAGAASWIHDFYRPIKNVQARGDITHYQVAVD